VRDKLHKHTVATFCWSHFDPGDWLDPVHTRRDTSHVRYRSSLRTTSAQSAEVLGRLGDDITTELHNDATGGLSADGNVEVNFGKRPALERTRESVKGQKDSHEAKEKKDKERSMLSCRQRELYRYWSRTVTTRMTLNRSQHCASYKASFDPGQNPLHH
jgi:hypothetical protein